MLSLAIERIAAGMTPEGVVDEFSGSAAGDALAAEQLPERGTVR